jgi:phosphatidylinositol alpha 1,6-mannosyltransferase
VFVHSGPHDTFGQTLQEAAASGLPVVAPAAGGPLDLVRDGVTGFLVRPDDATAMAEAVGRLVADPQLRVAQSHAARETVVGRSWPVMCDELLDHYEAVLASSREASGTAYAAAEELHGAAAGTHRKTAGADAEADETPKAEVAA